MQQATSTQAAPSPKTYTQDEVDEMLRAQRAEDWASFERTVTDFYAGKAAELHLVPLPG